MVSLTLENIGARYGRTPVVEGVSTPPLTGGTLTAVIGPNAAGKSSLFRRVAGLVKGSGVVHLSAEAEGRAGSGRRGGSGVSRPRQARNLQIGRAHV